jgi:protein-S-isoprenylcysteine O-methyltransferase Ste14
MYSINLGEKLFRLRGILPVPLIAIMIAGSTYSAIHVALGMTGILLGVTSRLWTVGYIGAESRTTKEASGHQLCTAGPYRWTRNPIYLANMAIYLGFAELSNTLSPLFPLSIIVIYGFIYSMIVRYEEAVLRRIWATRYEDYSKLVPRWIPIGRGTPVGEGRFHLTSALKSEKWTHAAIVATIAALILRWKLVA